MFPLVDLGEFQDSKATSSVIGSIESRLVCFWEALVFSSNGSSSPRRQSMAGFVEL